MSISACEYKSEFVCQSYQKCLSCWVFDIKIAYAIANETSGSFVASQRADELRNVKSVVSVKSQAGCF